jgi:hypothetical protein
MPATFRSKMEARLALALPSLHDIDAMRGLSHDIAPDARRRVRRWADEGLGLVRLADPWHGDLRRRGGYVAMLNRVEHTPSGHALWLR